MVFAGCSLLWAAEEVVPDHRPYQAQVFKDRLQAAWRARRRAGTRIPCPVGCVSRPRLGAPEKSAGRKTKVTKSAVAEAPARWFFGWRFGRRGALRASLRQNGI